MKPHYQISRDGIVYAVNPDSTITKYGRMEADGSFTPIDDVKATGYSSYERSEAVAPRSVSTLPGRRPNTLAWVMGVVAFIILLALGATWFALHKKSAEHQAATAQLRSIKDSLQRTAISVMQDAETRSALENELAQVRKELAGQENSTNKLLNSLSGVMPLAVSDIEMASSRINGEIVTDFGKPIAASSTEYLKPRLTYTAIKPGRSSLSIKYINPEGQVMVGVGETEISSKVPVDILPGTDNTVILNGWGKEGGNFWKPGKYRIEIWNGNSRIATRSFTLN
ncbi:MAG: hypothetical protein K2M79_04465 [Muribaculaceae bacterium]|nr:hypothetical protein [Muribaculaceae bacterium]